MGVVFSKRLLCCAKYPNFSLANILYILSKALQVKNFGLLAANVLTNFVDHEDNVLFSSLISNHVNYLSDAVVH